jgi:radical SAM superfamily enzyme YgiQ (UPF0313 family)
VPDIVLINPRFEVSYWGLEHALPILSKRANMPVACLPLLAALTPPGHQVTLVDENVEELDFARLARADLVGLTGMSVQRQRMREILTELKARGVFTAVGGPWISVQEDYFGDLADVIFVGEAEETWPQFLDEWKLGRHQRRYEQAEKSDMSRVPTPRFDLLKMRYYLFGSLQFSRGCPFQCEFCDIIVTFGRRPRLKTSAQVIAELEALRATRTRIVFIVDDNLIGNKKAVKQLLRDVIAYQWSRGYPFIFVTEASLDLAEDDELLALMARANIVSVFIGIESPNEESLREAKKFQNVRPVAPMVERVRKIQRAGLEVWSGMMLGFDSDGPAIFEAQRQFIHDARIINAMAGMVHAIPKTPLHDRLSRAGRLDPSDRPEFGTNVVPLRLSREELRDGYVRLMDELYDPEAYFGRMEDLYIDGRLDPDSGIRPYWRRHHGAALRTKLLNTAMGGVLLGRLLWRLPEARLRREYLWRLGRLLRRRPSPSMLLAFAVKCAMHYHQHTMARRMASGQGPIRNSF